ncbi:hypothetical protein BD289DRAFT_434149 [Coniella lustricola]|uniref:Uncharacterized protein n=1 Tax=Coniella lustricola TaxID=2025994 RepID=A0A2T3A7R7_9PEZI|nr:hypothetical protein BD289DRAFT_434149 [Coniella lustricola]
MLSTPRSAMRAATLSARTTLSTTYCTQAPRLLPLQIARGYAASHRSAKDDLGGPGGQEPADPTARDKQNAGFRNKMFLGLLLVGAPFFYLMTNPRQAAKKQIDNNTALVPGTTSNPGESLQAAKGIGGGR